MLKLRPHHISSVVNFIKRKEYKLSDNEFIEKFCSRNKKMNHNKSFILFWKKFCNDLYKKPEQKIMCSVAIDIICKNCDIQDRCQKGSELYKIALKLDEKAKKELNLYNKTVVLKELI